MSQFANLPQIGTLMLEHTFYEYGEPVLFVCTDQTANRYLCSCCRLSEEWLIAKTCPADLIDVIDDRLAFSEIFYKRNSALFFLVWDGDKFTLSDNVPVDAYPDKDSYLELPTDSTAEYRSILKSHSPSCFWESPSYSTGVAFTPPLSKSAAAKFSIACPDVKSEDISVDLRMSAVFMESLLGYARAHTLADTNCVCDAYEKQMLKIPSPTVTEQELQEKRAEQTVILSGFLRCAA